MRILPRSLLGQYHLSATAGICLWLPICKLDLCSMEPSSPKQETVSEEHYYQRYTAALYGGAIRRRYTAALYGGAIRRRYTAALYSGEYNYIYL